MRVEPAQANEGRMMLLDVSSTAPWYPRGGESGRSGAVLTGWEGGWAVAAVQGVGVECAADAGCVAGSVGVWRRSNWPRRRAVQESRGRGAQPRIAAMIIAKWRKSTWHGRTDLGCDEHWNRLSIHERQTADEAIGVSCGKTVQPNRGKGLPGRGRERIRCLDCSPSRVKR